MDGQILGVEAFRMIGQPQPKRENPFSGVFYVKMDLSELCQKKTHFWEFLHFDETHRTIEKITDFIGASGRI
jgi:hypothetical protein